MKKNNKFEGEIKIELAQTQDIPKILQLLLLAPDALLSVSKEELAVWIDTGLSFVAKTKTGEIIGHQAASRWPKSGWVEVRAAVVIPEHRGKGLNTKMKQILMEAIRSKCGDATLVGFTEAASKSRGILTKLGYQEIPLDNTPDEFFSVCPDNCVKKTGIPCGCKVFVKSSL